ncbi:DoxX family protein [Massilia sp. ST3]|uniref:DoxX family protein n=1 Tax=Massilia sp. ST3 TaxID=2824903 RepID=UPI001B8319CC|nr:DoxX family protein [Massilia sp. ST3]MBQ5946750.1 DoxX family protein [Massilia sp. ST3]
MAEAKGKGNAREDAGKLVLRVALGLLILLHGIAKLRGGVGFISGMLAQQGLPGALAYGVYVGEVLAPLLILAGVWTRLAAAVVAVNMVVAVALVHMGELWSLSKTGGWELELQGMFLAASVALALLGAGRYSVGGARGRFN